MQLEALTDSDIQRIHDATVRILEGTGIQFENCTAAHDIAREHGCKVRNDRIHFPKKLIQEAVGQIPDRTTFRFFMPGLGTAEEVGLSKGVSSFGVIGNAYYVYDYEACKVRDVTENDLPDKLLVFDNLTNLKFDACNLLYHSERNGTERGKQILLDNFGAPVKLLEHWVSGRSGLDPERISVSFPWASLEETRLVSLGHMILRGSSDRVVDQLNRMAQTDFAWCNPISPLRYHPSEAESIIRVARSGKKYRIAMISPAIMMGATGPITLAGTLVQHNCEVLAGTILAQMACPGTPVIYGHVNAPMDLRSAEMSHGNIETAVLNAAVVQLADFYGMPSRIAPGNTSARSPGPRSTTEAAIGMFMGAAAGGNIIMTSLLDATLMISYEHLVLVDELVNQIRSGTAEIATDAESLALEAIEAAAGRSNDFLQADHTYTYMKRDIYLSDYCGRIEKSFEDWYEKAHKRVKEILCRKELTESSDSQVRERLQAVVGRLREDDSAWREETQDWWKPYVRDFA
jgi:trimethylamine---corrinoid protein Co-methyltransferase